MTNKNRTYHWCITLLLCLVQAAGIAMYGQDRPRAAAKRSQRQMQTDSLQKLQPTLADSLDMKASRLQPNAAADSLSIADSIAAENKRQLLEITSNTTPQVPPTPADSLHEAINKKVFIPNPTKATWLALVIPGGGQIYNRKYWKLPIIYGGFAGCAYALTWNGNMYKDYMQAYKDAANGNWDASSINDLLPPGYIDRVSKRYLPTIPRLEHLRLHRCIPAFGSRCLCRCRTLQFRHHPRPQHEDRTGRHQQLIP